MLLDPHAASGRQAGAGITTDRLQPSAAFRCPGYSRAHSDTLSPGYNTCHAADDLANPDAFPRYSGRILPWVAALTASA